MKIKETTFYKNKAYFIRINKLSSKLDKILSMLEEAFDVKNISRKVFSGNSVIHGSQNNVITIEYNYMWIIKLFENDVNDKPGYEIMHIQDLYETLIAKGVIIENVMPKNDVKLVMTGVQEHCLEVENDDSTRCQEQHCDQIMPNMTLLNSWKHKYDYMDGDKVWSYSNQKWGIIDCKHDECYYIKFDTHTEKIGLYLNYSYHSEVIDIFPFEVKTIGNPISEIKIDDVVWSHQFQCKFTIIDKFYDAHDVEFFEVVDENRDILNYTQQGSLYVHTVKDFYQLHEKPTYNSLFCVGEKVWSYTFQEWGKIVAIDEHIRVVFENDGGVFEFSKDGGVLRKSKVRDLYKEQKLPMED